uniref:BHLH domain-containing protein n=1 Tax=Solanum lycopersicum TaxID=4081 RepID=K4DGQ9_SOLLC
MEQMGASFDEEYCQSLSKMFLNENSSDFMFQLHGEDNIIEGSFFSSSNSHTSNNNIDYFSQENSIDSRGSDAMFFLNNNTSHEYLQYNYDVESTNFYMTGNKMNLENSLSNDDYVMKENIGNNYSQLDKEMLLKRKFDKVEVQSTTQEETHKEFENPKKKSKVSRDHGQKNKKNSQPKAKKNIQMNNEEVGDKETNNNGQSTSSCSSEDDSNLKTKTRASRGAATDPQSLYARVDLSTMLEEAVHYVKFLQTQIKLLSSDDMWMYAPIAYNGMGIDL